MRTSYQPLRKLKLDSYAQDEDGDNCQRNPGHLRVVLYALTILLLLANLIAIGWEHLVLPGKKHMPDSFARTNELGTTWKQFWWNTAYSPSNHSQADDLWDAINPAHGIVAVDREWAADNHWPASGYMPDDKTKGVYLLEAYHHLHCLRMIRKTFWEAVDGRPFTHPPSHHMEHCFDALRQSVKCYADNTPLYSFGDFTAGDGQMHQCRDWNQLRDWATENTACYRDSVEAIPFRDHFGHCDNGDDGVR